MNCYTRKQIENAVIAKDYKYFSFMKTHSGQKTNIFRQAKT